jgi:hypothetical protein
LIRAPLAIKEYRGCKDVPFVWRRIPTESLPWIPALAGITRGSWNDKKGRMSQDAKVII